MARITSEELSAQRHLLKSDPNKYLELVNQFVRQNPSDSSAYFKRHHAWKHVGRYDRAMADLNKSLSIKPHYVTFRARGNLFRQMGLYREAIEDFNRSEALMPEAWPAEFGPLFRPE